MATLEEMNAVLERQRAYFASDDHIKERAGRWRDASPAECLAAQNALCLDAEKLLAMMEPAARERAMVPEPIPDDTIAILVALWQSRPRGR